MDWKDYIAAKKAQWVGKVVTWNGRKYKVVDVDSNAALMLDLPSRFNPTTAVSETDVTLVQEKEAAEMSYKIVMVAGRVKKEMYTGLDQATAEEICEGYDWQVSPDGGFVWDLEIEEE